MARPTADNDDWSTSNVTRSPTASWKYAVDAGSDALPAITPEFPAAFGSNAPSPAPPPNLPAFVQAAKDSVPIIRITLVVNYDLPVDLDSFIHRVGRTGRIGRKGEAWSLVSRDDAPQLSKIMATYGLDIVDSEVPELPDGLEREPIARQDDFGETADVFGFVTVHLDINSSTAGSSRSVASWFQRALRCDEMALGDVHFDDKSTFISIHTSKVGLALKALQKHDMAGQRVTGTIFE